jgi:beta-glucanase (GH16 family)
VIGRVGNAVYVGVISAAIAACADVQSSQPRDGGPPTWTLVWRDEFDGPVGAPPDSLKWNLDTADGCLGTICGFEKREKQYYTRAAENSSLTGSGQLAIVARIAGPGLTCSSGPCRYTSAKLTTRGKLGVLPGRVEARIKLPAGQGLWPAFKMLGTTFPATTWPQCGEIDVMENRGSDPRSMSSAWHGPGFFDITYLGRGYTLQNGRNFADDYYDFAVEWDSERVLFFADGTLHYSFTRAEVERLGPWALNQSFFIVLNLAVGGVFDGDPQSDAIFPATMLIDYVRVYVKS